MTRPTTLVVLAVILAVVVAGCGGGGTPDRDILAKVDPRTPVAMLERAQSLVPPEYELTRVPELVVYADGTVLAERDDGAFSRMELTDRELRRLARDLADADLGRFSPTVEAISGADQVVDADPTVITVRLDGGEHQLSAYALGLEMVRYPQPVEEVAERLHQLAERTHAEGERWLPDRGRLFVTGPASAEVPAEPWPENLPVPEGADTASVEEPATVLLEGAQVELAAATFADRPTRPLEVPDGRAYVTSWRPVLPHEQTTPPPTATPTPVASEVGTQEVYTPAPRQSPSVTSSSPTPVREDAEPPRATVSGAAGSLVLERGSSCWSQGPGRAGLCVDTVGPGEQTPGFATSQDETLTLSFDIDQAPDRAEISVWPVDDDGRRTEVSLEPANPTTYEVTLEAGSYYAVIFTVWEQGDASYHVRLDVS